MKVAELSNMYQFMLVGILFELPLYYFLIPSKDRKPELVIFVIVANLITIPLCFTLGNLFPIPIVNFLLFALFGAAEGLILHYVYSRSIPLKKAILLGAGISLTYFVFLRLLIS